MHQRKLPLLADIRDESADDMRLVLEPKSGRVDAEMLMEQLFRLSELEVRIGLNLNVLDSDQTPRVINLREALKAFLDHRHEVLIRRTKHRLEEINKRLEVLAAYLICYLNLDIVIKIVREEDEPKQILTKNFNLTDVQANAILNMRLRTLRKLEEVAIKSEDKSLKKERKGLNMLLKSEDERWSAIAVEIHNIRQTFENNPILGPRRTSFSEPPNDKLIRIKPIVEPEPITVICSSKGWLRALRGHVQEGHDVHYKEGDKGRFWLHTQTTDKLVLFATNGRFYTLACDKLPGGRGSGEPVRLMLDLGNDEDIVNLFVHDPERNLVVAASDGRGFIVSEKVIVAQTRAGKQVLNVSGETEAAVCTPVTGDHLAVVGENHKLLIFELTELPEMNRGRGVVLQRDKQGGLSDAKTLITQEGLTWHQAGGRKRTELELNNWLGKRGQTGRLAPKGFSKINKFG